MGGSMFVVCPPVIWRRVELKNAEIVNSPSQVASLKLKTGKYALQRSIACSQ
jgi:hypothetical protein